MKQYRLTDLFLEGYQENSYLAGCPQDMEWFSGKKLRLHIFALGDVGSTLLTGLRLMGEDVISSIGIYDVREPVLKRWEFEMNQVEGPWKYDHLPSVAIVTPERLFDCDVFVFCASLGIPPVTQRNVDVRMAQYEANAGLVSEYAAKAVAAGFSGLFALVSDPVDPLCNAAVKAGLPEARVKGFGLGVMNARAAYFARKDSRFASFLAEGAAFGPHGQDLVIANSLMVYDDELSRELTELTVTANLRMRELGFKPYIAPALSSGALSLLAVLKGEWHYSSTCLGGVFFGAKNRVTPQGIEVENPSLPETLYYRLENAYQNLKELG